MNSPKPENMLSGLVGASGPGTFVLLLVVGYFSRDAMAETLSSQTRTLEAMEDVREAVRSVDEKLTRLEEEATRERAALELRLQQQVNAERVRTTDIENKLDKFVACFNERKRPCP